MIRVESFITRAMLRSHPDTLFVFGDNMQGRGYGAQAAQMRGEPNAVGIPTKWAPSMRQSAFFSDADGAKIGPVLVERFGWLERHLQANGEVVWPQAGVGTGLAELQRRAPAVWALIELNRIGLFLKYGIDAADIPVAPPD